MIWFALREGWRNYCQINIMSLLTVFSLILTLILSGLAWYGYLMVRSWQSGLQNKFTIEAFLVPDTDSTTAQGLAEHISELDLVKEVVFVTKDQAAERFTEQFGQDLLELLGFNPLPHSLVISLDGKADLSSSWESIAQRISMFEIVDEVAYNGELLARIDQFYTQTGGIAVGAVALMLLISVVFTFLTIIGTIKNREDFIRILAMSGGTRTMAIGPFISTAGYLGITAGIIATISVLLIRGFLVLIWGPEASISLHWLPSLMLFGVLVTILTAFWAVSRKIREF